MSEVLLVLDFPGRRDEARISDLRLEEAGWKTEYLMSPPHSRAVRAREYATALAARYTGQAPRAVLAYCMAASLAQELAALISPPGNPVPLFLYDGEPAHPAALRKAVRTVTAQVSGEDGAGPDGLDALLDDAVLTQRPEHAVDLIERHVVRSAAGFFRLEGFDDEMATDAATTACGFYLDWLAHLVAAQNTDWPGWGGEVQHIRTPGHRATTEWPGAAVTENHVVDTDRNGLLVDPRTRDLTLSLLGPMVQDGKRRREGEA
ncbi:hypothetical protein [Streptomyces tendae]|uniref:hypothetical protein n=1 Tax=Streptomyces tendae TaxID=1932 RepID=UPI002490CCE6|nr:hypothetical protein [Streptomyces tendae]